MPKLEPTAKIVNEQRRESLRLYCPKGTTIYVKKIRVSPTGKRCVSLLVIAKDKGASKPWIEDISQRVGRLMKDRISTCGHVWTYDPQTLVASLALDLHGDYRALEYRHL